jgi:hypothetical protein
MIMACFYALITFGICLAVDLFRETRHTNTNFLIAGSVGGMNFIWYKIHNWTYENVLFNPNFFLGFVVGIVLIIGFLMVYLTVQKHNTTGADS